MAHSPSAFKVIPLGGVDEIGKNITLLEYDGQILILDCGMGFPDESMLGIDLVIPDFTYIMQNKDRIVGILLTHGHEDHIGSLPYLLRDLDVPIYGSALTLGLLEVKLQETEVTQARLIRVNPRDRLKIGCFDVEFLRITHSIQGALAFAITTPVGTVFFTGDFKVDFTPVDGLPMDFTRMSALGEKGILLLMADSTNVGRPGYTLSERTVRANLEPYFRHAKGRIIITTFSSNIHRVQQIVDLALQNGRKVCFSGRSMEKVVGVATELGELHIPPEEMIDISLIADYPDQQICIITTGSQGEPMSGLMRMTNQSHQYVNIKTGDTVILSAKPIPGNEKYVNRLVNQLYRVGANVVYSALADVHVSGHACQEELKLVHTLLKPKFFIPVHGEFRHLMQHRALAMELGMAPDHIILPEVGTAIEVSANCIKNAEMVPAGSTLVDGLGVGDVGSAVLRDRRHLSSDGLVVVAMAMDTYRGRMVGDPQIVSRGFVYVRDNEDLLDDIQSFVSDIVEKQPRLSGRDWTNLKTLIRNQLSRYLYDRTGRNPMILPMIVEVE